MACFKGPPNTAEMRHFNGRQVWWLKEKKGISLYNGCLWQQVLPKIIWEDSHVATPHDRKLTRPLRLLAVQCPLYTSPSLSRQYATSTPHRRHDDSTSRCGTSIASRDKNAPTYRAKKSSSTFHQPAATKNALARYYLLLQTNKQTTVLRLCGICPGQPGWSGTRRNIHPLLSS